MSDLVRLLLLCLAVELASTAVGVVMTDMSSVVVMVAMLCGPAPTVTSWCGHDRHVICRGDGSDAVWSCAHGYLVPHYHGFAWRP
jgi:hypothetical protein